MNVYSLICTNMSPPLLILENKTNLFLPPQINPKPAQLNQVKPVRDYTRSLHKLVSGIV